MSEDAARVKRCNTYETGGSVSTTALDVCLRLGCKSVAYIGLDLAYTESRRHEAGTTGVESIDTTDMKLVDGYELVDADNMKPMQVASSHLFDMYRQWIEKRVSKASVPVFDATEGGSIIKGLEIVTLKDYLQNN